VRRRQEPEFARLAGPPLPRTMAERIQPGRTSEAEVLELCGPPDEERNRRGPDAHRTLIYRAARRLPRTRRALGRLTTVRHWEEEHYELEIELESGHVSAVQSRIRRARAAG
jgi:NADPH-dependent ferric siderophore reductase